MRGSGRGFSLCMKPLEAGVVLLLGWLLTGSICPMSDGKAPEEQGQGRGHIAAPRTLQNELVVGRARGRSIAHGVSNVLWPL